MPAMNTVYAFVLGNAGLWVKVPFPPPSRRVPYLNYLHPNLGFGDTVYICDDLVAVSDAPYYMNICEPGMHFFKDNGGQWVEIGIVESGNDDYDISISELLNEHAMQDKYPICLSRNSFPYYAHFDGDGVVIVDVNSTRVQFLSSSVYGEGFGGWGYKMTIYEDLFVVGSAEHTHVFAQEDGRGEWEEVLRLDQSYSSYVLVGRTLIAVDGDNQVYSMIIADCTPEMSIQDVFSEYSAICSEMNVSFSFEIELDWYFEWGLFITTSEFFEEDSIFIQNYTGRLSQKDKEKNPNKRQYNYTDYTICLSQGWYRILFLAEIWGVLNKPSCYNVRFDFPESRDYGFEINRCVNNEFKIRTTDEIHFDIPRTTERRQPTSSPTISARPSTASTEFPTYAPTTSWSPTNTLQPTTTSTEFPTFLPTWSPTNTLQPTPMTQYPTFSPSITYFPTTSWPTTFVIKRHRKPTARTRSQSFDTFGDNQWGD